MTQYSELQLPSQMAALTNKVGVFDEYIAVRTGQYSYACLIGSIDEDQMTGTGQLVTASRTGTSSTYQLTTRDVTNEPIILVNEYYCYSNVGIGQDYNIPHFSQFTTAGIYLFVGMYLFTTFISGALKLWRKIKV